MPYSCLPLQHNPAEALGRRENNHGPDSQAFGKPFTDPLPCSQELEIKLSPMHIKQVLDFGLYCQPSPSAFILSFIFVIFTELILF